MQRFFAEPGSIDLINQRIRLTGSDVNHIRNVLRMKNGEELWVSDGDKKEYHCVIRSSDQEEIVLDILYAQEPDYELPCSIWLFQCLPKSDKMELIIQKAVELGAAGIVPVSSKRCVVSLDEKRAAKKRDRWQQIAEGAAKQSRRMKIPEVMPVTSFRQALLMASDMDVVLIPYEMASGMQETRQILRGIAPGNRVAVFIGPEGGFDKEEVLEAVKAGAHTITLGRRILRTETAGMTVLSILMYLLEQD